MEIILEFIVKLICNLYRRSSRTGKRLLLVSASITATGVGGFYAHRHFSDENSKDVVTAENKTNYPNGEYYTGETSGGQPHGAGKYFFPNGDWIEGQFQNGKRHGTCTCYYAASKRKDTGEYANDTRTGKGRMEWDNGDWYEGGWNDEGWNGKGIYYNAKERRTDSGDFRNNVRKGQGTMKWANGDRYEGTWDDTNGKLRGKGTVYYADGRTATGNYVNGEFVASQSKSESQPEQEPKPKPKPEPESQPEPQQKVDKILKGTVTYQAINPDVFYYTLPGTRDNDFGKVFRVTVTYKNAEGEMITEENITLPWKKQFEVTAPFTASITQRLALHPRAVSNPPLEFPVTYSQNMLCGISAGADGKTVGTDRLNHLSGGGGSLWKNIDAWMNANGTQTATLTVFPD